LISARGTWAVPWYADEIRVGDVREFLAGGPVKWLDSRRVILADGLTYEICQSHGSGEP